MTKTLTIADRQMLSLLTDALTRINQLASSAGVTTEHAPETVLFKICKFIMRRASNPVPTGQATNISHEEACRVIADLAGAAQTLAAAIATQERHADNPAIKEAIRHIRTVNTFQPHD